MFEACKVIVTDVAGFIRKGESYLEKWSLCRKNEICANKTERSWDLMELQLQESFKLKTGGNGEVWKNTQFG